MRHNKGHDSENASMSKKSSKLETCYEIYKKNAITKYNFTGLPSIAARHTALEQGSIQFDAGHVPRESGLTKRLVLISHLHSDHGSDIGNCIGGDEKVTIFVPAYCAKLLFEKIKCDMSMQKGRPYSDKEIVDMVRIVGCKRDNGEFKDQTHLSNFYQLLNDHLIIAELVEMGEMVRVQLRGREEVMVEPFACYHTIDTCGYVIHEVRKRLADTITFDKDAFIDNNFTEDQKERVSFIDDIEDFQKRHHIKIDLSFYEKNNKSYIIHVRRISFPNGMNISTKNDLGECILNGADFAFFKKYKICTTKDHFLPKTMFFGDTSPYVFNPKSVGFKRVSDLIGSVETVIIEATYLEYRKEMDDKKYKNREKKGHMFLFELADIFKMNPKTKFLLIHFSAGYDKDTITKYVNEYNKLYNNVTAFI